MSHLENRKIQITDTTIKDNLASLILCSGKNSDIDILVSKFELNVA